jgi:hypothetical protein
MCDGVRATLCRRGITIILPVVVSNTNVLYVLRPQIAIKLIMCSKVNKIHHTLEQPYVVHHVNSLVTVALPLACYVVLLHCAIANGYAIWEDL